MAVHYLHGGLRPFVVHVPPTSPALFLAAYHPEARPLCLRLCTHCLPVLTASVPSFSSCASALLSVPVAPRFTSIMTHVHWFRIACSLCFLLMPRLFVNGCVFPLYNSCVKNSCLVFVSVFLANKIFPDFSLFIQEETRARSK